MSNEKSDINWDLIAKHLVGETDKMEEAQLTAWVGSSEANCRFFADLEHWWQHAGQLALYGKVDTTRDWQKVKQLIQSFKPAGRIVTMHRNIFGQYAPWKGIAAVIAVLMVVTAVYHGLSNRKSGQHEPMYSQMIVPAGHRSQIILADGTSVWLNSGANLRFPANFGSDSRTVKLEGEAYFEVPTGQKRPFTVLTLGLEVKVYGTSFNVISYPNDASDEVMLLNGSLSVAALGSGNEMMLQAGQKITYLRDEHLFSDPLQADKETETAWRDGKLVFDDLPFGEIAKKLERRYGVTIQFDNKDIEQLHLRGIIRKETLEQAMNAMQLTAKFKYKIEDNMVTIF